jgi:hypothetical protein
LVAAGAGALGVPALASAGSGGAPAGSGGAPASTSGADVRPGNFTVSATSDGITIAANASAFVRSGLSVTGTAPAGEMIEIDQLGSARDSSWTPVATVRAQPGGAFTAAWHTTRAGPVTVRAIPQGASPSAATSPPAVSVTVYRRSIATLYGPGFYGQRTACGVILRRRTIGVANRTLPCGTAVQVYYRGRVMTVPVIDRGPYAHGANWDLTMAAGRALGMTGTAKVGAAAMPSGPTAAPTAQ